MLLIAFAAWFVAYFVLGVVVSPGEIGVRRIKFGYGSDTLSGALAPGRHWHIPMYSEIYTVPETVQYLHLHRNSQRYPATPGVFEVQTADGSSVEIDVSILYRFYSWAAQSHGGPADLLRKVGFESDWRSHVHTVSAKELKKFLGRLSTDEIYNPNLREQQVQEAQMAVNKILAPSGIILDAILLRRYTYADSDIDQKIFDKNLQEQKKRLGEAQSELAAAQAELRTIAAKEDQRIKDQEVTLAQQARVIKSEADLYEAQKQSEADLLVAEAVAEVDGKRAAVLASSGGAQVYVAKELAPILSSLKGGVVSELDPYDLDAWIERLGIDQELLNVKKTAVSRVPLGQPAVQEVER